MFNVVECEHNYKDADGNNYLLTIEQSLVEELKGTTILRRKSKRGSHKTLVTTQNYMGSVEIVVKKDNKRGISPSSTVFDEFLTVLENHGIDRNDIDVLGFTSE